MVPRKQAGHMTCTRPQAALSHTPQIPAPFGAGASTSGSYHERQAGSWQGHKARGLRNVPIEQRPDAGRVEAAGGKPRGPCRAVPLGEGQAETETAKSMDGSSVPSAQAYEKPRLMGITERGEVMRGGI